MFVRGLKLALAVGVCCLGKTQVLYAQQLGGTLPRTSVSAPASEQRDDDIPAWQYKARQSSSFEVMSQSNAQQKTDADTQLSTWNPWNDTKDGSERGSVGFDKMRNDGLLTNSYIFIYYDNFSINKSMTGDVRCSMRFVVTTTLDRKLNNLSMKLVWPEMETALTFQNIAPNVDAYQYYTLLGEGCYSLDKIPNIIVNRCRVANMSAQSCASKIRWLRKR